MAETTTTLARDVLINDQILYLASSATAAKGSIVQKGAEYTRVLKVLDAGAVRVQRGMLGTVASTASSGDTVTLGTLEDFVPGSPVSGIADGSALVIIPSNPPQDIIVGGDVVGPASATTGNFASFADASGSALADSGVSSTTPTFTSVRAAYKSSNNTAGVTAGPFTVITSITVKDGIITGLTGS